MISPQLRKDVKDLWTDFWSSGLTNPLVAIEQITYLLFIKRLEALDADRVSRGRQSIYGPRPNCALDHHPDDYKHAGMKYGEKGCPGHYTCRWEYIRKGLTVAIPDTSSPDDSKGAPAKKTDQATITPHDHLSKYVFPWLREIETTLQQTGNAENGMQATASRMEDAYFQLPPEKTATLQKAIGKVDQLFARVGRRNVNQDIMGDIFEYLLSEIKTSGKNGQFRTPRHIIRFMIELLAPEPAKRVIDPAAGTGGFLINSVNYQLKRDTPQEDVILEWDGEPHRITGGVNSDKHLDREFFTGFDNDRTMVRIGWMNMLLHGIEDPNYILRDTLSKKLPADESNSFAYALANPPFKGTVDKDDLHETRFPRHPTRSKEPITNRTQLLYIWLILDLLETGGRAAVIVPDGVLFGSGTAEQELRRALLFENRLEAVVSLPAGVFQPYAGVKTSIIVFQKVGDDFKPGDAPRTESVWFYSVTAEGYSLDQKRDPLYTADNDLWDCLAKWPKREVDTTDYYRPIYRKARWRLIDKGDEKHKGYLSLFPEYEREEGKILGIDERTHLDAAPLDPDPDKATQRVLTSQHPVITELYRDWLRANQPANKVQRTKTLNALRRLFTTDAKEYLEDKKDYPGHARNALDPLVKEIHEATLAEADDLLAQKTPRPVPDEEATKAKVHDVIREFAKLDGYDVWLRSLDVKRHPKQLNQTKSWSVPVRILMPNPDWTNDEETIKGTHDEHGTVRPEFMASPDTYTDKSSGIIKAEFLDSDCIEANDLNLSAQRYEPFVPPDSSGLNPVDVVRELQGIEDAIKTKLSALEGMLRETP